MRPDAVRWRPIVTIGTGRGNSTLVASIPRSPTDDTVTVARVTDQQGDLVAVIVNYACHPTTLAWENTLISPDYVGAMRETVEQATGSLCIFTLGACGDLGPREGFVGDTAVADPTVVNWDMPHSRRLSRWIRLPPISSTRDRSSPEPRWAFGRLKRFDNARAAETRYFSGRRATLDLACKPKPDEAVLRPRTAGLAEHDSKLPMHVGDALAARDATAQAERVRRWLGRLPDIPKAGYCRLGTRSTGWATPSGSRAAVSPTTPSSGTAKPFPGCTVGLFARVRRSSSRLSVAEDRYGLGFYQEEPSILAPGCLEALTETLAEWITELSTD
jgi:hypothetical protein